MGQEGGAITRGMVSRLSSSSIKEMPSIRRVGDAFQHDSHIGPISGISTSPFHRNLFLTGGNDGRLKLYNILNAHPLKVFEPVSTSSSVSITAVSFSPHR